MAGLILALLLASPLAMAAPSHPPQAAPVPPSAQQHNGSQAALDLSFHGYPHAQHNPHSLTPARQSLHAPRSQAVQKDQPPQVLPSKPQAADTAGQALLDYPHHMIERDLLPYEVERASGLFSESNGLRGFMAHNWLNQTLGLQGGMAFRQQQYRQKDSTLRDNMAVGMGFLLAF